MRRVLFGGTLLLLFPVLASPARAAIHEQVAVALSAPDHPSTNCNALRS